MLTCAHNVVGWSDLDEESFNYTDLTVFRKRKGEDMYSSKSPITKIAVHPNYNGKEYCGFDIAICRLGGEFPGRNYDTSNYSVQKMIYDNFPY